MTDELNIVVRYLIPSRSSFWQWRDLGEVVAWIDGRTITFRAELAEVLAHLAPQGLPPLGAVLLLLAGTRDSWGRVTNELAILTACLKRSDKAWADVDALSRVIEGLDKVRTLEADLRKAPAAKAVLAEVVFEGSAPRTPPDEAAVIAEHLAHRLDERVRTMVEHWSLRSDGPFILSRDLHCLADGLRRVDPEVLKLRRRSGLDALPQAAEVELPPSARVRALLAELVRNDDELRGLARLALNLMAAVTLPRPVADREEMQVGGVSDITNRGPLDRLLLSELAHDDLSLAVRVAVNEALYLRRESPPRTPPRQRTILLDAGIRSWGVPRVFATAVALALTATSERHTEVVAYSARGNQIERIDLTTRDGLVAHLEVLQPELHPGLALDAFQAQLAAAENCTEPILVTTDDVVADDEFRRSLADHLAAPWHIATVNRDGRFRLLENSVRGSKQVKEAQLDLAALFQEPDVAPTLVDRDAAGLPAILSVEPFPLLLSHNVDAKRAWCVEQRGVLALAKDRRLMFWRGRDQGALQISDRIPRGRLWWSSRQTEDGFVRAVVGEVETDGIGLLHVDQCRCGPRQLAIDRGVRGFCSHGGVLFAVYPRRVQVIAAENGETVQQLALPAGVFWRRDRFFSHIHGGTWYALAYDGRTARLEEVLNEQAIRCPKLITLYEREGVDGPIGITARGDLYSTATGNLRRVNFWRSGTAVEVLAISPDGRRIVLAGPQKSPHAPRRVAVIDTDTLAVGSCGDRPDWLAEQEIRRWVRPANMWHRFTHIAVVENRLLALTTRKGQHFAIEFIPMDDKILLGNLPSAIWGERRTFKSVSTNPDVGYRLLRASWEDGSEAFLDSRGLLHLRSSDTALPEISIVLAKGELAGWCSDGRMWGAPYFIGERESAAKRDIYRTVITPFAQRLR